MSSCQRQTQARRRATALQAFGGALLATALLCDGTANAATDNATTDDAAMSNVAPNSEATNKRAINKIGAAAAARPGALIPLHLCVTQFAPYQASNLPGQGPMLQIMMEALRRAGYAGQPKFAPWARNMALGERGLCAIVGIWRDPHRDTIYHYSAPLIRQELGLYGRVGVPVDLQRPGLRIGVQRDSYLSPPIAAIPMLLDLADDLPGNLRKLALGRIDLVFSERNAGAVLLAADPTLRRTIEWKNPSFEIKDTYLAVARSDPHAEVLLASFNRGLASMHADGSYTRILREASLGSAAHP